MAEPGPEMRALLRTRYWLVSILTIVLVGLTSLVAASRWGQLSALEHVCAAAALPLAVAGVLLGRRKPRALWLTVAAAGMLALAALVAPSGSPPWIPLPNAVSYPVFIAIVLSSRRVGRVLVPLLPALIVLIWWDRPTSVIAGPLLIGGGWIAIAQALATSTCTWWVWNLLVRESRSADEAYDEREQRTALALVLVERARIWRAAAAQLHESVLNSIRYVLSASTLDRSRLADTLAAHPIAPDEMVHRGSSPVQMLMAEVASDPAVGSHVRTPLVVPDVELSAESYAAARSALVELARNAVSHGGATTVDVGATALEGGDLIVTVTDDGHGVSADAMPGFGTRTAIDQALADVGGTWALTSRPGGGTQAVVHVPLSGGDTRRPRSYQPFDKGRLLITSVLAGSATVGTAYFVVLLGTYADLAAALVAVLGVAGVISAVALVVRRQHTLAWTGVLLILVPAALPWILGTETYACSDAPTISPVLNVAGFCVIVIAAWSGALPGAVGVVVWATGAVIVTAHFPPECRDAPGLALANSILVMPIALTVTYIGVRSYERAARRQAESRRRELRGQATAQTAVDLNTHLFGAVEDALSMLGAVATGAEVDERMRSQLEVVDARIRAAIQVDPVSAGAFAALAKELVDAASSQGVRVRVRALGGSDDRRPVPRQPWAILSRALAGSATVEPILQVFTDGTLDYLTMILGRDGLLASGLSAGDRLEFEGTSLAVLTEDEGETTVDGQRISVVLTRPVARPAEAVAAP